MLYKDRNVKTKQSNNTREFKRILYNLELEGIVLNKTKYRSCKERYFPKHKHNFVSGKVTKFDNKHNLITKK